MALIVNFSNNRQNIGNRRDRFVLTTLYVSSGLIIVHQSRARGSDGAAHVFTDKLNLKLCQDLLILVFHALNSQRVDILQTLGVVLIFHRSVFISLLPTSFHLYMIDSSMTGAGLY